jgi:hypothetical protein
MTTMMRHLLVAVVAAGALSATANAQEARQKFAGTSVATSNPKADEIRAKAESYYTKRSTMRKAASLHEKEAALRVEADPRSVEALDRAARLYAYTGDQVKGTTVMEKAARLALRRGDVGRAAHAMVDAAFMALQGRDLERAVKLTNEADLLALSPLLSATEKVAIVRRIDPARASLGVAQ